jgi:2,4-dienoyl-CoA reductase (NADPH2)
VTLFDAAAEIGGQFNLARRIPGKDEFAETLRYYRRIIERSGVELHLGRQVGADDLAASTMSCSRPASCRARRHSRHRSSEGRRLHRHRHGRKVAGERVAIIGAGGIGFDVGEFLTHHGGHDETAEYCAEWGIDIEFRERGGSGPSTGAKRRGKSGCCSARRPRSAKASRRPRLDPADAAEEARRDDASRRRVRRDRRRGSADPDGWRSARPRRRHDRRLRRAGAAARAAPAVAEGGRRVTLIGGADVAVELDARRAIAQGTEVALRF